MTGSRPIMKLFQILTAGQTNDDIHNDSGFAEIDVHMPMAKEDNMNVHKQNKIYLNGHVRST